MIEYKLSLASSGAVKTPGSMDALQLGYSRNCGVYRLRVSAADEWRGMTLRAFWHTPGGSPPASLVEDGVVEVPALVTAVPGEGCITFEGSDGVRTLTSADLRYRVAANSGTEDGTLPPPGTPAWQQLVGQLEGAGADAEKSAARAETAQSSALDSAAAAARSLKTLQEGIASGSFKGEKGDPGARGAQGLKGDAGPQGPKGEKGDTGPAGRGGKGGGGGCHSRRVRRGGRCQGRRQRVGRESRCQPYSQLRRFFLGGRYGQQCQRIHLCGPDGRPRCRQQPCHQQGAHRVCVKGGRRWQRGSM